MIASLGFMSCQPAVGPSIVPPTETAWINPPTINFERTSTMITALYNDGIPQISYYASGSYGLTTTTTAVDTLLPLGWSRVGNIFVGFIPGFSGTDVYVKATDGYYTKYMVIHKDTIAFILSFSTVAALPANYWEVNSTNPTMGF